MWRKRLCSNSTGLSTPKLSPQRSEKFYVLKIKTSFCLHEQPTKRIIRETQPLSVSVANISPLASRYKRNYSEKFCQGRKEKRAHRSFHSNARQRPQTSIILRQNLLQQQRDKLSLHLLYIYKSANNRATNKSST